MEENGDGGGLLPGCRCTYRTSYGIRAARAPMTESAWLEECKRAAEYLDIPYEQHQGIFFSEYLVGIIDKPIQGLLGNRLAVWILLQLPPALSGVRCCLDLVDGGHIIIEGPRFDALAWAMQMTQKKYPHYPTGAPQEAHEYADSLRAPDVAMAQLVTWLAMCNASLMLAVCGE